MSEPIASAPAAAETGTAVEGAASEPNAGPASPARAALAGVIAAAIALACVLPPLVHFVTGPLGPLIGAFVVALKLELDGRGRALMAAVLGLSFGALAAAAAAAAIGLAGPKGPPDWFPPVGTIALIVGGASAYAAALGAVGAVLGARWNRSS